MAAPTSTITSPTRAWSPAPQAAQQHRGAHATQEHPRLGRDQLVVEEAQRRHTIQTNAGASKREPPPANSASEHDADRHDLEPQLQTIRPVRVVAQHGADRARRSSGDDQDVEPPGREEPPDPTHRLTVRPGGRSGRPTKVGGVASRLDSASDDLNQGNHPRDLASFEVCTRELTKTSSLGDLPSQLTTWLTWKQRSRRSTPRTKLMCLPTTWQVRCLADSTRSVTQSESWRSRISYLPPLQASRDLISDPARQLLAVRQPAGPGVVTRYRDRPKTPLIDAALLTNAHGEPSPWQTSSRRNSTLPSRSTCSARL